MPPAKKIDVDFDSMFALDKNEPLGAKDPLSDILGKSQEADKKVSDPLSDILQISEQKTEGDPLNDIFQITSPKKTDAPAQLFTESIADDQGKCHDEALGDSGAGGWGDSDDELDI